MELKVKNLASSDSRGYDLQKEVTVKVTNRQTHQVRLPLGWATVFIGVSGEFPGDPGLLYLLQPVQTRQRGQVLPGLSRILGTDPGDLPLCLPSPHRSKAWDLSHL